MDKSLFMRSGGEGVASWLKLVAFMGAVALVLSTLTLVPSQARAEENSENTVTELADTTVSPEIDALPTVDIPVQEETTSPGASLTDENEPSLAETILEGLEGLDQPDARGDPTTTQVAPEGTVNTLIDVEIDSINGIGTEDEGVSVGDDVLVEGTWDAMLADDSLGTIFWVTFPTTILDELKIEEPVAGASLLRDADDNSVIGFEVDTTEAGTAGDWQVKATTVAATDEEFLNFRTSENAYRDVEVQLPGEGGIRNGAAERRMTPLAAGDQIPATVTKLERDPVVDPDTQLVIGDKVRVEGTWDATGMDLTGGETFTIGFPAELTIPAGFSFDMFADGIPDIDDGTNIGECVVNPGNTLTCTVNDEVAGKQEVEGTWWIQAEADQYTNLEQLTFTIPGGEVEVPLPGPGGGIGDGSGPLETKKSGQVLDDRKSIRWTVDIAGPLLAPLADDTDKKVVLEDTLSDALQLCEPARDSQFRLLAGRPDNLSSAGTLSVVADPTDPQNLTVTVETNEPIRTDFIYRLEYITCTTDGGLLQSVDADDDTYSNTILIGDRPVGSGIGEYRGWEPTTLNKRGSLLGGADRFQKARWDITQNGANLVDTEEIVITDTFGPNQQVCGGGLNIQVFKQDHLPTWNPENGQFTRPSINISNQFEGTNGVAAAGATGFNATLKPQADFEFDPNAYYIFRYHTCLTTGEIPTDGDAFTNTAMFNRTELRAETKGQKFEEIKNGSLVTRAQEVGGESQPAGTTTNWTIRVDGQKFEERTELVVTDEFSDALAVCEVPGKSLKERLNFKLEARDFVNNGGLATENLTDATDVELNGNELKFTLDAEAFGEKHFDRNYSYYINYTLCTSSGGLDAAGTKYSNSAEATVQIPTRTISQSWDGGAEGGSVARGSFSLMKSATAGSKPFSPDLQFRVLVEEFAPVDNASGVQVPADLNDPAVRPYRDYEVVVRADGKPVSGQFIRGQNWQIRLTEVGFPENSGFLFGPGQFIEDTNVTVSDDGTQAVVTIAPRTNTKVQLQNTASLGKATLTKLVEGETAESVQGQTFTVNAFIRHPDNTSNNVQVPLRVGAAHTFRDLPIGTTIEFEEAQLTDTDVVTWGEPVFSQNPITVGENTQVTLTNKANASAGTFSLKKALKGTEDSNAALPQDYTVTATWGEGPGETKDLTVRADGTPEPFGQNLPTGTEVTLTEVLPQVNNIDWGTPVFSGEGITVNSDGSAVVTIGRGNVDLTVTNTAVRTGTFQLSKGLAGEAADDVPNDAVFTVQAEWKKPGETKYTPKELTVTGEGTVELGENLPVGTEVRFSEIKFPEIAGIVWGTPVWGTNPTGEQWLTSNNGVAEGIISDDPAEGRLISVTNVAKFADRPVYITKQVEGPAAGKVADDLVYKIQATFSNNEVKTYAITAGEPKLIGNFPVGTKITFSEIRPPNTNEITWGEPTFSPGTLTVGTDLRADVTVTNVADQTVGTFSVKKLVEGPEQYNDAVPDSFEVIATWTEGTEEKSHTMTVPVGGEVDFATDYGQPLPAGTEVTLTEVLPPNGEGLAWSSATFVPGNEVTIGLDPVTVKLKNYVDKNDGTLQVLKAVTGDAAEGIGPDVEFTVKAEWKEPGGTATSFDSTELTLKNDGVAVPLGIDLSVGTEVRFTEIDLPEIAGIEWVTPQWDIHQPEGSWLRQDAEGVATGIVSDDPVEGRIIKLTNDATWKTGELEITKKIVEGDKIYDVKDSSIDEDSEFEVRITGIDPALRDDVNFPKVGQSFKLNKANDWTWSSGKVLPKGTKVTFEEVNLRNGAGYDWAKPYYVAGTDGEGEFIYGNEITITGEDKTDTVEIHNRLIPTTEVDIDKIVTGPKGNEVENDASSTFQVTTKWVDADGQNRTCVLNVTPRGSAVPTSKCDATVIDGKVHFPTDTEITFTETGAYTDVPNVKWGEVIWSADRGAKVTKVKGDKKDKKHQTSATVVFTGGKKDKKVTLRLENKTSSDGLILLPLPIPILPIGGGSSVVPVPTNPTAPAAPGEPVKPTEPTQPARPTAPGEPGKPVNQEKQAQHAQATPGKRGLASTGANVLWLAGGAAALIIGGAWLALRGRRNES